MIVIHINMATLPTLVSTVAALDGRERVTIEVIARAIREAGFITNGKRGAGAPAMTVGDAVNLLIGANAVQAPKLAVAAVEQFRTYKQSPHGRSVKGPAFERLAQADTLPDALAVLIEDAGLLEVMFVDWVERAYGRPYDPDADWLSRPGLSVTFTSGSVDVVYESPNERHLWRFQIDTALMMTGMYTAPGNGPARRVTTTITFPMILAVHDLLFGEAETAAGTEQGAS